MRKLLKAVLVVVSAVFLVTMFVGVAMAQAATTATDTQAIVGVFTAFVIAVGPLAILTERGVAVLRMLFGKLAEKAPSWFWIVLAFIVALVICLGWQYNLIATLAHSIPAMADQSTFDGVAGQVLTGLCVGAAAGVWHEKFFTGDNV